LTTARRTGQRAWDEVQPADVRVDLRGNLPILHLLGRDLTTLMHRTAGRDFRLTNVEGREADEILTRTPQSPLLGPVM
jgi:hypothetical protein